MINLLALSPVCFSAKNGIPVELERRDIGQRYYFINGKVYGAKKRFPQVFLREKPPGYDIATLPEGEVDQFFRESEKQGKIVTHIDREFPHGDIREKGGFIYRLARKVKKK